MQFILTDLQKEIKENAEKLLSEQIDLLETIKKVDDDVRIDSDLWKLINAIRQKSLITKFSISFTKIKNLLLLTTRNTCQY